jgi:hypothetical protein
MSSHFIRHGALQLSLPSGWFDASQIVAVGPEDNGFRANLVVSLEPTAPGETVQQFAVRSLAGVRQSSQDFTLGQEQAATFGPNQGVLRECSFNLEGTRLAQLQFMMVKDLVGYVFIYTQRSEKLAQTRTVAEAFFATAQLDSKAASPVSNGGKGLGSFW